MIRHVGRWLGFLVLWLPAMALAQEPTGTWVSEEGEIRVRIGRCGEALCGPIVWMRDPAPDSNNPNPDLRKRSLIGVNLISELKREEGQVWVGLVYNPEDGKSYTAKVRLLGPDVLELSGCVLGGLICRATRWTRYQEPAHPPAQKPPSRSSQR